MMRQILLLILNILGGFIALVIGARIIFMLLGVNPTAPIVAWVNDVSSQLVYPFSGIFQNIAISESSVIDITGIIALIVYAVIFSILRSIIYAVTPDEVHEHETGTVHSHV